MESLELLTIPKEMVEIEINKWLLEIDRQILRRVNKYFNDIFPFNNIDFNEIDLQIVHLQRYRKLWSCKAANNLARWGRIECLKFVKDPKSDGSGEGGIVFGWAIATFAAEHNQLECLKYLRSTGAELDEE